MTRVASTQGDMFVVVAIERSMRIEGLTVKQDMDIFIPITFNTLEEAKEWCEKVKVKNRDYLIFGTWNPANKAKSGTALAAVGASQSIFAPAC